MPSKMHQMLVGLIARKMRERGYGIVAFDGTEYCFDGHILPKPPAIGRHRPDILGIKIRTGEICIGEAKIGGDLRSNRTARQLADYSKAATHARNKRVEVILGVPQSDVPALVSLLRELGLHGVDFVSYVWLPEVLVNDV